MRETLLRFVRPHRQDCRALVGFLALVAGGSALLKLASEVAQGDTFAIDKVILRGLGRLRTPPSRSDHSGSNRP